LLENPVDDIAVAAAFSELNIDSTPLGRGGMKNAYRGSRDGVDLVLKVVREPVISDDNDGATSLPNRIRREIDGMRAVQHPSIVRVIEGPEIAIIDGQQRVWYIEPFYSGGTLESRLGAPHPEPDVIDLMGHLSAAVEVLSEHGIVHRDIKPGNIVFDSDGVPVLLDLGIAFFVGLTPLTNQFGASPRTDVYAAPEQFDVRNRVSLDARTDLFLVGMVAFEMLTGIHPFRPDQPDNYFERLLSGNIDISALNAVEPTAELRAVLHRLLAPNQAHRYRKVKHAIAAIEGCR
jgi:serine/threonine protein kinase